MGLFAALVGVFVGVVEHGGMFGPIVHTGSLSYSITFAAALLTIVAAIISTMRTGIAVVLYVVAIVAGVLGSGTIWELPGAFIFLAIILLFINKQGIS